MVPKVGEGRGEYYLAAMGQSWREKRLVNPQSDPYYHWPSSVTHTGSIVKKEHGQVGIDTFVISAMVPSDFVHRWLLALVGDASNFGRV
ncbi:hypothetical protein L1987_34706 [Smallanthus sonchifolius]|uniref:Uncharacterized protein n=1 Tax=Smallanthus sonchifolius TaxID=185202 RepID=A0ACB9HVE6_9ASTR|nr:hypothetical protein L1987_34706 [Smallanthus sonchifolius]